jgi:murein DD-endopeptidase MepM/ murein hydrolase activator NlpD
VKARRHKVGVTVLIGVVAASAAAVLADLRRERLVRQRVQSAEHSTQLDELLSGWHLARRKDAADLEAAQRAAEEQLREVSYELGSMQTQILRLESLATRLAERADLADDEFDFDSEPGVGGPEEPTHEPTYAPTQALPDSSATRDPEVAMYDSGRELSLDAGRLARQVDDRWRQLSVLEDLMEWRELDDSLRPEGRPVAAAYVSSRFGARTDPFTGRKALHKGIDFAGRRGTAVVAVAAGIVTWSGERAGYGQMIEIDHGNQLVTRYAHNSRNLVAVGDVVTRGQTVAELGSTGRATGPNLHFEVLQDGQAVDPLPYIE